MWPGLSEMIRRQDRNKLTWSTALASLVLFAGFGAGCGKKVDTSGGATESTAPQPAAQSESASVSAANLPGAKAVMAALDKKDYEGAMAELLRVSQTVSSREQQVQFSTLTDEVRVKLLEAGPGEPKVAEALSVLRRMTAGR